MVVFRFLLSQPIKPKEGKSNRSKYHAKNADPHKNARGTLRIKIYKEIRIDERRACGGDQNGGNKLQNDRLDKKEYCVYKRKRDRSEGIIPLHFLALVKQEPVGYVENGKHDVEAQAANTPVCLGIAPFCAGKHNVEYKEGQKNAKHADKFQHWRGRNVAILLLFCRLDQSGKHNADAKVIADVGEMHVKIPTNRLNVIKDSQACNHTNKAERAIDGLIN